MKKAHKAGDPTSVCAILVGPGRAHHHPLVIVIASAYCALIRSDTEHVAQHKLKTSRTCARHRIFGSFGKASRLTLHDSPNNKKEPLQYMIHFTCIASTNATHRKHQPGRRCGIGSRLAVPHATETTGPPVTTPPT